jgi:hypothetical protein
VPRRKPGFLHIEVRPPVGLNIGEHRVEFVGLTLLDKRVIIEYDVDPPFLREHPFGPALLKLRVTDDLTPDIYPTMWEDFPWPTIKPNRLTTRLNRRPAPAARRLHFEVLAVKTPRTPLASANQVVLSFDVELPATHALPWSAMSADRDGA